MASIDYSNHDELKEKLTDLGLYELGMDTKDMIDLMAAIRNSRDSAQQEELIRESKRTDLKVGNSSVPEVKKGMERRYKNAPERRMPWNLFPFPEQLTLEQRACVLAAYKEQQRICRYHRSKTSSIFAEWKCVISIPILSKSRVSPEFKSSLLHTRSGRTLKAAPHYIDDDSDTETSSSSRKCRKKMRKLSNEEIIAKSSLFKDPPNSDQTNFNPLIESDKKQNETKMQLDVIEASSSENTQKNNAKLWSTPSPEEPNSTAMTQTRRESSVSISEDVVIISDDHEINDKDASAMVSRKRVKRLKVETIDV